MPIIKMPDGVDVSFPDDMPDDAIRHLIQTKFPDVAKPRFNPDASVPLDVAKQAGVGVAQGVEGIASGPAHLSNLVGRGIQAGLDYISPEGNYGGQGNWTDKLPEWFRPVSNADRASLQESGENYRGKGSIVDRYLPQPETRAGDVTRTVANYTTQMLGNKGNLGVLATGGVGAGLGGYAGREVGGPVGELIGSTLGGVAGMRGAEAASARLSTLVAPTQAALENANTASYANMRSKANTMNIPKEELGQLRDDIKTRIGMEGPRETSGKFTKALDKVAEPYFKDNLSEISYYKTPNSGNFPVNVTEKLAEMPGDVHDLISSEKRFNKFFRAAAPDADKAAAFKAKEMIMDALDARAPEIGQQLRATNKDYAIQTASEALSGRIAEGAAKGAQKYSGLGKGDAIRDQVGQFLNGPQSKYLSDSARAELERVRQGTGTEKIVRWASKLLGGGSGLGAMAAGGVVGGVGAYSGHPELGLAAAGGGLGLRMVSNRMTKNSANVAAALLRNESSLGRGAGSIAPRLTKRELAEIAAALASRSPATESTY